MGIFFRERRTNVRWRIPDTAVLYPERHRGRFFHAPEAHRSCADRYLEAGLPFCPELKFRQIHNVELLLVVGKRVCMDPWNIKIKFTRGCTCINRQSHLDIWYQAYQYFSSAIFSHRARREEGP